MGCQDPQLVKIPSIGFCYPSLKTVLMPQRSLQVAFESRSNKTIWGAHNTYEMSLLVLPLILLYLRICCCVDGLPGPYQVDHPRYNAEKSGSATCSPLHLVSEVQIPRTNDSSSIQRKISSSDKSIIYTFGVNGNVTSIVLDNAVYFRPTDHTMDLNLPTQNPTNDTLQAFIDHIRSQEPLDRIQKLRSKFMVVEHSFQRMRASRAPKVTSRSAYTLSPEGWLVLLQEYRAQIVAEVERMNTRCRRARTSGASSSRPSGAPDPHSRSFPSPPIQLIRGSFHGYFLMRIAYDIHQVPDSGWSSLAFFVDTILYFCLNAVLSPILEFLETIHFIEYNAAFVLYHVLSALLATHDLITMGANPLLRPLGCPETEAMLNVFGMSTHRQASQPSTSAEPIPADSIVQSLTINRSESQHIPDGGSERACRARVASFTSRVSQPTQ